jgi:hypothetical protein
MFSANIRQYLLMLAIIAVSGYAMSKVRDTFDKKDDEYDLIKKYLLNESPLYGNNRTKLWIHSKYELNTRKWKDFYSRSSTDLNQPYIHLTIKTIINHCGNDFNICLIDDDTFSKLIPTWDIDLTRIAEPMRSHFRELGMAELLYIYGGMVVPNSFVCTKNLKPLYDDYANDGKPFICENNNHNTDISKQSMCPLFTPDTFFMGCHKNDPTMRKLVDYLKMKNRTPHFSSESDFRGDTSQKCIELLRNDEMNLVPGQKIGVKTNKKTPILLEDLMEEEFLDVPADMVGVYIPADEILSRPKYQWFAVLPGEQLLKTRLIVVKYLIASLADGIPDINKSSSGNRISSI